MYLLYAPPEKFNILPPRSPLICDEVLFTNNLAYCTKFFWKKHHLLQGCRDLSPRWLVKMRQHRQLNKILIIATGGFGDVMWAMPAMNQLRTMYPRATILVATDERTQPIFLGVPYANACVSSEFWNLQNLIRMSDEVYDFGGIATFLKKEMVREPVEACFFHIELPHPNIKKDMRPHLVITLDEGKQAEATLRRAGVSPEEDKIITIALESSTPNRNWVFTYARLLTQKLLDDGHRVIWLSESKEIGDTSFLGCSCGWQLEIVSKAKPTSLSYVCPQCKKTYSQSDFNHPEGVVNLGGKTNIREAMAIIALSDVFIGPCSGLMVVATSLEIPTIGLFGAFNPNRISKYYEKFIALWGKAPCAPCSEHWTECREGYPAPCMKRISWEEVYDATNLLLKKYPRQPLGKLPIE